MVLNKQMRKETLKGCLVRNEKHKNMHNQLKRGQ